MKGHFIAVKGYSMHMRLKDFLIFKTPVVFWLRNCTENKKPNTDACNYVVVVRMNMRITTRLREKVR